ncbi:MAG TPA: ribonuclease P protein component [Parvibaculum sp.]|jgi:ribonuclease P protein component
MTRHPELPRLQKRAEFLAAARASKWAANGLVLQALQRGDDKGPRAGFTVTKKVGNAVIRNRARRRLKEAAREILPLHAKAGYDYVLVGRLSTLTRAWPDLLDDLRNALAKVHGRAQGAQHPSRSNAESKEDTLHG